MARIPTPGRVRGTQDIFREEQRRFARVLDAFDRVRRLYGFERVEVPVFEDTAVFARSIGETTDVVSKVVPPLNEVAFAAYARLQGTPGAVGRAFLTLVRAVMVVAMPFYMGLASAAEPVVLTALGPHWHDAAPIVALLALSMPAYTLYVLLGPVCDALGRPGIATANGATAAVIAPLAVIVSVQWGIMALAASWIATCWPGISPIRASSRSTRSIPAHARAAAHGNGC